LITEICVFLLFFIALVFYLLIRHKLLDRLAIYRVCLIGFTNDFNFIILISRDLSKRILSLFWVKLWFILWWGFLFICRESSSSLKLYVLL